MPRYTLHRPQTRKSAVITAVVLVVLFAFVVSVGAVRYVYSKNLQPVSASQHVQNVTVPSGASAHEIAVILRNANLIRHTWAFEWYVRNHNLRDKLQAGTYELRPSQSIQEIAGVLSEGKVTTNLVTILPGQRIDQIKQTLLKYGYSEQEVNAALNPKNYTNHPALADKPKDASLEGYLYPDSYRKDSKTSAYDIVKLSLDEMQKHLTPEVREAMVKQGLTVHQGIILASIIDREVGKVSDKKTVSQVFLKRLREGMPLGSDVTVLYGAIAAGQKPSLTFDSPYNTHLHAGLPIGPISNVTASSLQAVINPADTDYLYFVSDRDGNTYFAHTIDEHNANVTKYCKDYCNAPN